MDPPVVLGPHEVERSAIEPVHHQGPVFGERTVHVGGSDGCGTGSDRQSEAARVLRLHGQEPLGYCHGVARRLSSKKLGSQALGEHQGAALAVLTFDSA